MSKESSQINAINSNRKRSLESDLQSMNTPILLKEEAETGQANKKMSQRSGGVQRYLVAVEYIGTNFVGFQKQPNGRTVQGMLEDAFSKFIGQPVSSACSSRTDAGVHALANVCHVDVERISKRKPGEVLPPHEAGVVKSAVNHFLQKNAGDMSVVDVRCVPINFHARYKAQERTYYYRILSGREPLSTFDKDRSWHVPEDLNISLMKEACKVLVGHHDFSSFRASGCQAKSPIKTLTQLDVFEIPAWPAFPSSTDRNCRVYIPDKKDTHLSFEGKDILDEPVQNEENIFLSCEHPVEFKMPVLCPEDHKDYNEREALEFGRRRGHRAYVVTARGPSFLYHQVRLLVGALKCVGTGNLSVEDVERILKARSIMVAPPMAPAHGLYLAEVKYDFSSNGGNQIEDDGLCFAWWTSSRLDYWLCYSIGCGSIFLYVFILRLVWIKFSSLH